MTDGVHKYELLLVVFDEMVKLTTINNFEYNLNRRSLKTVNI